MQAAAWLGMSITALVSYNCHYDFTGTTANFGTLLRLTMVHMYFRGSCTPNSWPTVDFNALNPLNLMTPSNVYIWMWVVAALSFLWLVSSIVLITSAYRLGFRIDDKTLIDSFIFPAVNKKSIRYSNISLYFWIFITFSVSMIDLVLFVLFIVDYNTIMQQAYTLGLNFSPVTNSVLITAQNTAGTMASIALRGYILWFFNVVLSIYLFTQTFRIYDFNQTTEAVNKTGQSNVGFQNEEFQGHSIFKNQPIAAYGEPVQ